MLVATIAPVIAPTWLSPLTSLTALRATFSPSTSLALSMFTFNRFNALVSSPQTFLTDFIRIQLPCADHHPAISDLLHRERVPIDLVCRFSQRLGRLSDLPFVGRAAI